MELEEKGRQPKQLGDSPLKAVALAWQKKIKAAEKHKKFFSDDAREAMAFFDGPANWMWNPRYASNADTGYNTGIAPPAFRMQCNRVFEAVKLFGAVMYHRNPTRTVSPNKWLTVSPEMLGVPTEMLDAPPEQQAMMPPEQVMLVQQMMQQAYEAFQTTKKSNSAKEEAAKLLEAYLNFTPDELNLKEHSRRVVDEAIIKGAGLWWTELVEVPGTGQRMIGSFYDSVDNFVVDPDADNMEDILWCAKKCIHPIDHVCAKYGLTREDLKGHVDQTSSQVATNDLGDYGNKRRRPGQTNELVVYYKVWSKTGFGDTLKDFPKEHRGVFQGLGDNCYIVIAEGIDFPLNAPPSLLQEEVNEEIGIPQSLFDRAQWPIPFWVDPQGWPFTMLAFHRKPGYVWPISHIKPGVGELRFLNWAFSWLATRVSTSCETMIGVSKAADDDIKDQILAHTVGGFKIVELSEHIGRSVNDIISIFQLPDISPEIWKIINAVSDMFDKRCGLTELAYGMSRASFRSAAEAATKSEQISVRPDDMANCLEDAMGRVARNEAIAARWLLEADDLMPALGPMGAMAWKNHVSSQDPRGINRDFQYRVESGSSRKPNVASRIEQMNMALQTLGPILSGLIGSGVVEPFNALIRDWGESLSISTDKYLIPPPPPPAPAPLPAGSPPPSGQESSATGGGQEAPPENPDSLPQIPPPLSPS